MRERTAPKVRAPARQPGDLGEALLRNRANPNTCGGSDAVLPSSTAYFAHAIRTLPLATYCESMQWDRVDDWYLDDERGLRHLRDYLYRLTVYTLAAAEMRGNQGAANDS